MPSQPNENDRPITLKDLNEVEARIEDHIVTAIGERMETLETKLLTAFHGYTERTDNRLKRMETAEATTAARMASLEAEDRFTALELRILEAESRLRKVEQKLK